MQKAYWLGLLVLIIMVTGCTGGGGGSKQFILTVETQGQGTVTPEGAHQFAEDTVVNVTATAAEDWEFVRWEGEVAEVNQAETTVVVDKNKTVRAVFAESGVEPTQFTLTVEVQGQGTVTPAEGTHAYDEGTLVQLTATPAADWEFVRWEGEVAEADQAETAVLVNKNKTVRAVFEERHPEGISGTGTQEDPFVIYTFVGLEKAGRGTHYPLSAHYLLGGDIDASPTQASDYKEGQGWKPIDGFQGVFDGNGYTIKNLYISRENESEIGLFGSLATSSIGDEVRIMNIALENVDIVGRDGVAGLVGKIHGNYFSVEDSSVQGSLVGRDNVGGLIGELAPDSVPFKDKMRVFGASSQVNIDGRENIGGLIGLVSLDGGGRVTSNLHLENSTSEVNIIGERFVGGLVGRVFANRTERAIHIDVVSSQGIVQGNNNLGGLIGANQSAGGRIDNFFFSGEVNGFGDNVGGAIGWNTARVGDGSVEDLRVTSQGDCVGGLIGYHRGELRRGIAEDVQVISQGDFVGGLIGHYAGSRLIPQHGSVDGGIEGRDYVGGLIGKFEPSSVPYPGSLILGGLTMEGNVTGRDFTGGLFGSMVLAGGGRVTSDLVLENSDARVDVTGENYVGGLIGYVYSDRSERPMMIDSVSSQGTITGNKTLGGLFGFVSRFTTVERSWAEVTVEGFGGDIGGLVGKNAGHIERSYATGAVSSQGEHTGGLVGHNDGLVLECYARVDTLGTNHVGGLVGMNDSTITHTYSSGSVAGSSNAGGLIGSSTGNTVIESFWDAQTSGQTHSSGGEGNTTEEMMTRDTFGTWNFITVWNIEETSSYPYFRWQ